MECYTNKTKLAPVPISKVIWILKNENWIYKSFLQTKKIELSLVCLLS